MDLDELVVTRGGQQRRTRIRTVAQAADFAGIKPGAPEQIYRPVTPLSPDAELRIDRESAQRWPEHFDMGITAARVNYGVSPGDEHIGEPYPYVGPFDTPPPDEFWNAPFGAMLGHREVTSVEAAVAFFHAGRDRARSDTSQRSTP